MGIICMCIVFSLLMSSVASAPVENRGYIFVGDSRTVGMDSACDVDAHANIFVVAEVGQGYWWLTHEGWDEVEKIKSEHDEFDTWTIVSNLGANDITKYEDYIEFYDTIEDDFVFVSVNPVGRGQLITNEQIAEFNANMVSAGFVFIDTNIVLQMQGFSTPDGLHYSESTYEVIFDYIMFDLDLIERYGVAGTESTLQLISDELVSLCQVDGAVGRILVSVLNYCCWECLV